MRDEEMRVEHFGDHRAHDRQARQRCDRAPSFSLPPGIFAYREMPAARRGRILFRTAPATYSTDRATLAYCTAAALRVSAPDSAESCNITHSARSQIVRELEDLTQ